MRYFIYEYGKQKTMKECRTLHEALRILHSGKENKVYRIRIENERHCLTEVIQVRYKNIEGFIITEIV